MDRLLSRGETNDWQPCKDILPFLSFNHWFRQSSTCPFNNRKWLLQQNDLKCEN